MSDKEKELCPRLIDYLVIVGKRNRIRNSNKGNGTGRTHSLISYPEILRRYPTDDHQDFPLPTDVTVFCQPEGCTTLDTHSRCGQGRDPQFFVFMLTEKDSAKIRYGVCLNFYQRSDKRVNNAGRSSERTFSSEKTKGRTFSLTSLCLISHHPFVSIFHDLLVLLKHIIDGCNYRAAQKNIIRDLVWSVLTGHWHDVIPPEAMREIKEIETWILMLLSSPVPVPGKTKVQLEVMPPDISPILEFALPDHTRFCLVDFPLHLPFELLGVDAAVRILAAIMLEFKVVIQSRNYNAVSMCVLSLVHLLYPLEYMFPVIPLLPAYMPSAEQLLLAPTPFLIGVPASFFAHKKIKEAPSDIILVDLDTNHVTVPDDIFIPKLPEPDATNLKNSLSVAINKMSTVVHDEGAGRLDSSYAIDADMVDISCRVAMIKFFNSPNVFGNFSEHTRTLRLYPRPVVTLQSESFLRSRPQCTQFITDLCRTQAVEYFAECCLCPKNEAFVRVQAGIESPSQIGDKAKWFNESLMPVHFTVYPNDSSLSYAYFSHARNGETIDTDSDENDTRSIDSSSSIDDLVFDDPEVSEREIAVKPLAEVNDVYKEPLILEIPPSDSVVSVGSSFSSGRSSPASSVSASAVDSEADFARLAENLALKSDSKGDFSFDHEERKDVETTPISRRRTQGGVDVSETTFKTAPLKGMRIKGLSSLSDSGEMVLGPTFMSTINGYAEKSQGIFNQVFNKTAPKAQALRERTMKPLAAAAATTMEQSQHLVKSKTVGNQTSSQAASQQCKNQQTVRDICDSVIAGQGVGVFTYPKLKRLMEDESLRELVCSKLNSGLEQRLTDEDYVKEVALTRAQYKGYVRVLQACIAGIEVSFNTPGCCGLASVFHVLEIAHTHYWCKVNDIASPSSSTPSAIATPSSSSADLKELVEHPINAKLTGTFADTGASPLSTRDPAHVNGPSLQAKKSERSRGPSTPARPPLPPRETSTSNSQGSSHSELPQRPPSPPLAPAPAPAPAPVYGPPKFPPPERKPPPVPPRSPRSSATAHASSKEESKQEETTGSEGVPPNTLPPWASEPQKVLATPIEPVRHYIYQDLILPSQNPLWQKLIFWENAFVDVVAQERDIVGMDQEPSEMIERYAALSDIEKKRLELEEDRLLSTLLHNMTAYMIMCGTGQKAIQQKIRRLLGKAHIGLVCSKEINKLLDKLPQTQGNSIPLKPLGSRLVQKHSFAVHEGSSSQGDIMFMEFRLLVRANALALVFGFPFLVVLNTLIFHVCDDAVVLRAVTGMVIERWWYERLVNMTYSPKTKVLCLWRRHEDKVYMHKFYTKKCRELYQCMKKAMERAAARGRVSVEGRALGGEFPVHDTETNQGGLLQVRCDGITLIFANSQHFIDLANIKKCNTFGGNVFLLEEYDRKKSELVQRRYYSQMADQICYAVLCVFSFAAAGHKKPN